MPKRSLSSAFLSLRRDSAQVTVSNASATLRGKMPLFSEHISNMYYSGTPSYISSPYSYVSSFTPLGTSYSASYINPGASYSNHSSLGGYSRKPITSRWISSGRSYSPMLSTISERGTSSPVRINSPRRVPIQNRSNRTYVSPTYNPRPVNINTADIDVSRDKYRNKVPSSYDTPSQLLKESSTVEVDKCPLMPRVEDKPETGIDTSPGIQRGTIKRERTVVRLHTLKRKERDSPRKPVEELQKQRCNIEEKKGNEYKNKEVSMETKRWRDKLSKDLIYKDTREKKTLGAKLIEKFQVKNKDADDIDNNKNVLKIQQNTTTTSPVQHTTNINHKSTDRRCSMELLAEQASLLDSLIRKENLSTATLDLSKVGRDKNTLDINLNGETESSDKFNLSDQLNPLTTTKSDHSLNHRLNNLKDQKHSSKRRSIKKSSSGSNIYKLDSITEFPKELSQKTLPAIEESRLSLKDDKIIDQHLKTKPILKAKITSTVEITPSSSPLRFKVENITVEEKPHTPKKEIMFSSQVENEDTLNSITRKNYKNIVKSINAEPTNDPESPEPEDGNFWNKIGKRETVYLVTRKQKLAKDKENLQSALIWTGEDECNNCEINNQNKENNLDNITNNQEEKQNTKTEVNDRQEILNYEARHIIGEKTPGKVHTAELSSPTKNACNGDCDSIYPEASKKSKENIEIKLKSTDNILVPNKKKKNVPEVTQLVKDKNKETCFKNIKSTGDIANILDSSSVDKENLVLRNVKTNIKEELINVTTKPNLETNTEKLSGNITQKELNSTSSSKTQILESTKTKQISTSDKPKKMKKGSQKGEDRGRSLKYKETEINCKNIDNGPIDNITKLETLNFEKPLIKHKETITQLYVSTETTTNKLIKDGEVICSEKKINLPGLESNRQSCSKETSVDNNVIKVTIETKSESINSSEKLPELETMGTYLSGNDTLKNIQLVDSIPSMMSDANSMNRKEEKTDFSYKSNTTNKTKCDNLNIPSQTQNIPNSNSDCNILKTEGTKEYSKNSSETLKEDSTQLTSQYPVENLVNTELAKPIKEQKALKPLIATPRPLLKKVPQLIRSSSSSESSSDEETSDDGEDEDESSSSEGSGEFFECDNNPDGRTSTGSNDSGFDSSASMSPAGFICVRKDCDVNCHRKCEKLTANLCGVNQRLLVEALASRTTSRRGADCPGTSTGNAPAQTISSDILERELEQSTAYGLFRKTGRFTPPARSIPRFRKYTIEDFQFIKVLGKGSFGKVLLAELRDTEYYYAVKCLKKDVVLEDDDVECTLIERKVLALGTNHPYLCHLFATFQTDSHLFFVMEYLNGGDLMFHIQQSGRFPEPRARFYAAEIVSGLKFLHKRGIIYRDLKLDNILLDFDGHVRIADFGMCKLQIYLDKTADTFCGTPDYMAPEIIKGLKYNQAVDWWSFGVLLYEMLIGQSPFSGCDEDELFWSICNEMPSYPRFLSQEALSILTRLLDKDARSRLGGAECMHGDVREQDFFHAVAWDRLERRELEAPFKPRVRHPLDTQYFDRAFTGERPRLTAVEPHVLRSMDQEPFRGFSYTNPNATDR